MHNLSPSPSILDPSFLLPSTKFLLLPNITYNNNVAKRVAKARDNRAKSASDDPKEEKEI